MINYGTWKKNGIGSFFFDKMMDVLDGEEKSKMIVYRINS